ncbi:MAG: hypothetical protein HFE74_07370 [Firmicutes bacterium]|jgi:hypothetical protein|nr:hypothetical protein [Bacillota bacterium]
MQKEIDYKSLLIASGVYALMGAAIKYITSVLLELDTIKAAEIGVEINTTGYFTWAFFISCFNIIGVFSLIYWSIWFTKVRKNNVNLVKARTLVIPAIFIFIYVFFLHVLWATSNFLPYLSIMAFDTFFDWSFTFIEIGRSFVFHYMIFFIILVLAVVVPKHQETES